MAEERSQLGPLSRGERTPLIVFATAVFFWFAARFRRPDLRRGRSVGSVVLTSRADEGVVAIIAASLLFLLPTNWSERKFTLNWNQAAQIDWGTILLFGSGITLGTLLSSTGLAEKIGDRPCRQPRRHQPARMTILATVVAILISETTSNTASVGIVVPIIIPIATAAGRLAGHPGSGGRVRRVVRLHAAGVDAAQCDRLRLRHDPDHEDGPLGCRFRRHRCRSHRHRRHDHGSGDRGRLTDCAVVSPACCGTTWGEPALQCGIGLTPGLRTMTDRVGAAVPFAPARRLLAALFAGLDRRCPRRPR